MRAGWSTRTFEEGSGRVDEWPMVAPDLQEVEEFKYSMAMALILRLRNARHAGQGCARVHGSALPS